VLLVEDARGDQSLAELATTGRDLPDTDEALDAHQAGSRSLFYASSEGVPTVRIAPGLALLGEGAWTVLPPTIVPACGEPSTWLQQLRANREFPELPRWVRRRAWRITNRGVTEPGAGPVPRTFRPAE
jgi:hypothetical protein